MFIHEFKNGKHRLCRGGGAEGDWEVYQLPALLKVGSKTFMALTDFWENVFGDGNQVLNQRVFELSVAGMADLVESRE